MTDTFNDLSDRLIHKKACIGIIGLGYVGLPLLLRYISVGYHVIGIDIDKSKIDKLNANESYINHISQDSILEANKTDLLSVTTEFSAVSKCDALILCVPTPLNKFREPELKYVRDTVASISEYLKAGQVISLESTTYPGTTEEEIVAKVEGRGFSVGDDLFVVYSPEREDPGNINFETSTIPKICGGHTAKCLEIGLLLYKEAINQVVPVTSTKVAEMTKLLENIHRAVNIGLVNEMKIVCDKMGVDVFEVIDAAATKPFGFTAYYPGPGLGGHCIPIDPFYLTWKAKEFGIHTRFIELAGEINRSMPEFVVTKLADALNEQGLSIKGSNVLLLGLSYKKNIDDLRESPSLEVLELLRVKGANLSYNDPFFPVFPNLRDHHFNLSSVELTETALKEFDCVLLATDHDSYDYDLILKNAKLILDTRGKFRDTKPNVIKA